MIVDSYHNKIFKNYEGKMVKGIRASSHSPMDVTQAANNRLNETKDKVISAMEMLGLTVTNEYGIVTFTSKAEKKPITLVMSEHRFPTYSGRDLDPGYQTTWLTFSFK